MLGVFLHLFVGDTKCGFETSLNNLFFNEEKRSKSISSREKCSKNALNNEDETKEKLINFSNAFLLKSFWTSSIIILKRKFSSSY
jgi:hypothetical protein